MVPVIATAPEALLLDTADAVALNEVKAIPNGDPEGKPNTGPPDLIKFP